MENNSLVKLSLGINALLVIAVIILFVKMPGGGESEGDADTLSTDVNIVDDGVLTIAYYNSDTMSTQADFVMEIQKEIEASNIRAQQKMENKQKELERWQKGWEEKGPLLPREEEQYMIEAQQKQFEAAQFEQNLQMEVGQEQETLMITLYQRLQNYAKGFCQEQNIDMLVSYAMGGNVIYMNPNFEVTKQFLNYCNKEYNSTFDGASEKGEGEEG